MNLAIALVHYPIYNRKGEVGCTSVTNFDLHDLARLARTYGLRHYYVIHPYQSQREMVSPDPSVLDGRFGRQTESGPKGSDGPACGLSQPRGGH